MKVVTTVEAIEIIVKGLGIKGLARSTFTVYYNDKLVTGRLPEDRGQRKQFAYYESEIIKSIERIREYRAKKVRDKIEQGKAKTRRAKDNIECKEPTTYATAFNLFNRLVA